jgi:hypothetical protein
LLLIELLAEEVINASFESYFQNSVTLSLNRYCFLTYPFMFFKGSTGLLSGAIFSLLTDNEAAGCFAGCCIYSLLMSALISRWSGESRSDLRFTPFIKAGDVSFGVPPFIKSFLC